ncbi:SHOCT domain-containing protein [Vibrio sp.]|uniref:SHOCT domain-containing protein n=1 Tax=Vibrio sp. TaxID=678 RepID=UPI003D13B615
MMVFWVVIVGLVLWALFSAKGTPSVQAETPLEIAQKRYAKGEISKQEFDDIRHNL